MSAKNAVLGLVIERPGYGYDLARRLQERFGSSGFAPTGVYSALDQLTSEELVRSGGAQVEPANERAAPRTIYEATSKGVDRFEEWMLQTSSLAPVRDELYMKIALSKPHNLARLIELTQTQEQDCLARLQRLRQPAGIRQQSRPKAWADVAVLLVRDAEIKQLQARVEWLQRARTIMHKLNHVQERSTARGGGVA
ncbi:MAG TPA: PadR family transcriptional regulator [Solirubrobacteraceae bacterium]|jgi:DNA-binding PadR family transcriptional regulator|nr:PadR family transcriptional regulator [Solirubrobacteraceae bacterium]